MMAESFSESPRGLTNKEAMVKLAIDMIRYIPREMLELIKEHPVSLATMTISGVTAVISDRPEIIVLGTMVAMVVGVGETFYSDCHRGIGIVWNNYKHGTLSDLPASQLREEINGSEKTP